MINSEWGKKHTCSQCGTPFYDMKRSPAQCPKCGAEVNKGKVPKQRRSAVPLEKKPEPVAPVEAVPKEKSDAPATIDGEEPSKDSKENGGVDLLEPVEGGEEDDGVIEDASDIGENDDDLSEVLEHVDEGVADNT